MKEAIETLATFELFKGRDPSQFSIERLGGLTNKNFKVVDGENKYVLRIPGEGTEEYINRKAEEAAARISADVGVNAEVSLRHLQRCQIDPFHRRCHNHE